MNMLAFVIWMLVWPMGSALIDAHTHTQLKPIDALFMLSAWVIVGAMIWSKVP